MKNPLEKYEDKNIRETFPSGKIFRISFDSSTEKFKLICHNSDDLSKIIERFSDKNPSYFYMQQYGYSVPPTISVINHFGQFPTGFVFEILKHIKMIYGSISVVELSQNCRMYISDYLVPLKRILNGKTFEISNISQDSGRNDEIREKINSMIDSGSGDASNLHEFFLREYQYDAISEFIFKGHGRGVFEVGTAGGKSFILSNLIYNLDKNVKSGMKYLLLVPNKQLVFQMYKDFEDYGMDMSRITRMTGGLKKNERYNPDADVIIGNRQQVFNSYDQLPQIDVLICDEVHTALAEKTSNLIEKLNPKIRVGCSGSIPRSKYDRWRLIGMFGNIIFEKSIGDLQKEGYVSSMKLYSIQVTDTNVQNNRNYLFHLRPYKRYSPDEYGHSEIPFNAAHDAEHEYYEKHYRELYKPVLEEIAKFDENTLLLFDKIEFGKRLTEMSYEIFKGRKIHYIDGSVDVKDRLEITRQMEESGDNVLFAENMTFSTGVNIKRLTNLVFVTSSKSFPFLLQSVGRTLRLHSTKKEARIFDISYNFKYSQRHLRERLNIYNDVYHKKPDEIIKISI